MSRSVKVQKTAKKINWRRVREEELEERMDEEMREIETEISSVVESKHRDCLSESNNRR